MNGLDIYNQVLHKLRATGLPPHQWTGELIRTAFNQIYRQKNAKAVWLVMIPAFQIMVREERAICEPQLPLEDTANA